MLIDGHLDVAMNALRHERDQTRPVSELRRREARGVADERGAALVSLPELRDAGAGLFAGTLISRVKPWIDPGRRIARSDLDHPDASMAYATAQGQLAYYRLLHQRGQLRIVTQPSQLDDLEQRGAGSGRQPLPPSPPRGRSGPGGPAETAPPPACAGVGEPGCLLLMEGADPIVEPAQVHAWHAEGLRLLGLAHFGHSRYAAGTPPMDAARGEQDAPLSPLGLELLREMRGLAMGLDLSHLSETSFHQAAEQYDGPICASHSNCRALAPSSRQISDAQIRTLVERGGVIGLALHYAMLRPGYAQGLDPREVRLAHAVEHIDHICQIAGSADHVALGSDLDGGFGAESTPADLQSYADLHRLAPLLQQRGFGDQDVAAFFYGNWLRFYRRVLSGPHREQGG